MTTGSASNDNYTLRKKEIAASVCQHPANEPIPYINYLPEEHMAWKTILSKLASMHDQYACEEYLTRAPRLGLQPSKLEQLSVVSRRLKALVGWQLKPAKNMVDTGGSIR